jgi:opacity protein-like surface antigen
MVPQLAHRKSHGGSGCFVNCFFPALPLSAWAGVASAADMPLKAPPPAAYDWSGFYIGGVIGGGWGDSDSSIPGLGIIGTLAGVPVTQTTSNSGFIGGIEGGDRYQLGKLVVGWEADMLWVASTAPARRPLVPRSFRRVFSA